MKRVLSLIVASFALASCGGGHHARALDCKSETHGQHSYATPYGCQAHSTSFGKPPSAFKPQALKPTAPGSVEMFDSVNVAAIPSGAQAAAGYTAGLWPTFFGIARRFLALAAHGRVVSIAISWAFRADCLDVEPGDAWPNQAAAWVRADEQAGFWHPCIYTNASTLPSVKADLAAHGVPLSEVRFWVALWVFHPFLYPGSAATQWTDHGPQGQNFDESLATPGFFGYARPKPPPARPVCFGARANARRIPCPSVLALYARRARAAHSSLVAYERHGCLTLTARERWFATRLREHPRVRHAYRSRALAATRRAEGRQGCAVFAQRARWFTNADVTLRRHYS